jgi:DNA polymerase III subunit gamma/tau
VSYLALARKYRPQTFADIVGQEHVVRTLQNSIKMDRVHHAFLFTGARGVGKTTTARILAAALNAEAGPSLEPSSDDPICAEIAAGSCPDLREIDGASNNGVDNIRELIDNARYLPSRARYKIYIIDEVHMLSKGAFNALLKILEEPPPHVKFMFATTEPQKIPVTILSRCQRFDFRKVSVGQLTNHLKNVLEKEALELGPQAIHAVVREAEGSVRDAMSLLDQVLSFTGGVADDAAVIDALGIVDRQTIFELFQALLEKNADTVLAGVDNLDTRGHDLADVCTLLVEHVRDLMVFKSAQDVKKVLADRSPGELENLSKQADMCTVGQLHRMFAIIVDMAGTVTHSSFQRVSLEMGLLRVLEVEPATRVQDLLDRVDKLLEGGGPGSPGKPKAQSAHPASKSEKVTLAAPAIEQLAKPEPKPESVPASKPQPQTTKPPAPEPQNQSPAAAPKQRVEEQPPMPVPREELQAAPPAEPIAEAEAEALADDENSQAPESQIPNPEPGCSAGVCIQPEQKEMYAQWQTLVSSILQENPFVASILEHARLIQFEKQQTVLGFDESENFFNEGARQSENFVFIQTFICKHFNFQTTVKLRRLSSAEATDHPSLAQLKEAELKEEISTIEKETRSDPRVLDAVSILGGKIKSVVVLKSES